MAGVSICTLGIQKTFSYEFVTFGAVYCRVDVSSVGSPASALGRSRAPAPARTEEESSHSRQANIIETTTELLYLNWYNLNDL